MAVVNIPTGEYLYQRELSIFNQMVENGQNGSPRACYLPVPEAGRCDRTQVVFHGLAGIELCQQFARASG